MFFDGPQNPKSLKYWADDEGWFMSGLFYSTKILLKKLNKGSVCTKPKNGSQSYEHVQVSKAYTRRTNDKVVCLSVFFFLMYYLGILIFLRNVLSYVHICPLVKKIAPLLIERIVKCTHLKAQQFHRGC